MKPSLSPVGRFAMKRPGHLQSTSNGPKLPVRRGIPDHAGLAETPALQTSMVLERTFTL